MKQLGEFWRGRVEAALELNGIAYDTREAALEAPGADERRAEPAAGLDRSGRLPGARPGAEPLPRRRVVSRRW